MTNTAMHMNSRDRRKLAISEIILIVVGVLGLAVVLWLAWFKPLGKNAAVSSYASCVAAGNAVQDSYPSVCVTKQGARYVNPSQKLSQTPGGVGQPEPQQAQTYLSITELGIRLKLADVTKDAYYVVSTNEKNGVPVVYLSTRSLDKYPLCKIDDSNHGVAAIETFKDGQTDEVEGDFSAVFPKALTIRGVRFFVTGSQFDCSGPAGSDGQLYRSVRQAFVDSYGTIEAL